MGHFLVTFEIHLTNNILLITNQNSIQFITIKFYKIEQFFNIVNMIIDSGFEKLNTLMNLEFECTNFCSEGIYKALISKDLVCLLQLK